MKKLFLFFALCLAFCSYTAQAQIVAFNNADQNTFYGIGGYSFTKEIFTPDGVQPTPYLVSGPSPQNDFSYAVSAVGGIINVNNTITDNNTNTPISIQLKGNNIRKFGCQVFGIDAAGTNGTDDFINLTATTNLGLTATQTGNYFNSFVGFSVNGNVNEYIVSVTASFQTIPSPAARIALNNIIVGDNTPSQVNLSNITGTIDSPTYAGGAIQTITSTARILAPAGAIDFKAPNAIILSPGFEARGVGRYFQAQIRANVTCSN